MLNPGLLIASHDSEDRVFADVMAFAEETRRRLVELETHDERAAELDRERAAANDAVTAAANTVAHARRAAAPRMAEAVQTHLTARVLKER